MPWPLKPIDTDKTALTWEVEAGTCWYSRAWLERQANLSRKYRTLYLPHRLPIVVVLPGGHRFCLDRPASDAQRWDHGDGWDVVGDLSNPLGITVTPSINLVGHYHGWIRDGVITDDCEGRRFTPDGLGPIR